MTALIFNNVTYNVKPKFEIICEIEEELGAVSDLLLRFMHDDWKVSELVTIIHIALQYTGKTVDYVELGNKMITDGLSDYLNFVSSFLRSVIYK